MTQIHTHTHTLVFSQNNMFVCRVVLAAAAAADKQGAITLSHYVFSVHLSMLRVGHLLITDMLSDTDVSLRVIINNTIANDSCYIGYFQIPAIAQFCVNKCIYFCA